MDHLSKSPSPDSIEVLSSGSSGTNNVLDATGLDLFPVDTRESSEDKDLAPCPPGPPPLGIETKFRSLDITGNGFYGREDEASVKSGSKRSIFKRLHNLSIAGPSRSRSLVTSGQLTGHPVPQAHRSVSVDVATYKRPWQLKEEPQYATLRRSYGPKTSRSSTKSSDDETTDEDDVTTIKAKSGSLASLSSKASSTLSRMMSIRRRKSVSRADLQERFPNFYVSSYSSPSTPLPESKRPSKYFQSQESKSQTMTAYERAKIVMRMRGSANYFSDSEMDGKK